MESLYKETSSTIGSLKDDLNSIAHNISKKTDAVLTSKLDSLSVKSSDYISTIDEMQKNAQKRFTSFYGRKKILDILVMVNLAITPILLLVISYLIFLKK